MSEIVKGSGRVQVFLNKEPVFDRILGEKDRVGLWWQGKQIWLKEEDEPAAPPPPPPPPANGEVLPWGWSGVDHKAYLSPGDKRTYIIRVPQGLTLAGVSIFAYIPEGFTFNSKLTCLAGHTYTDYYGAAAVKTWQIIKPGANMITLTAGKNGTVQPNDGTYVPPGDYVLEISVPSTAIAGTIMIQTVKRP